jgi:aldehyde:ferredoxin oxidoreductase
VLGSKNVKAVVARGTGGVAVSDARAFAAEMRMIQSDVLYTEDNMWATEEGTGQVPMCGVPVWECSTSTVRVGPHVIG